MKTIIKIFICLSLIYTPMFANAAKLGGWSLSNPVAQGASTVYDATKNVLINGKDFVKNSWVKITPNATQVAKVLARGAAGYALSVAVEQLLGAVDWVLDPANNRITYVDPNAKSPADTYCKEQAAIKFGAGSEWAKKAVYQPDGAYAGYCVLSDNRTFPLFIVPGTPDTTIPEEDRKSIPLDVVAQQVISNANAGDSSAQVATTAASSDVVAEAEKDDAKARPIANQAEANAETKPADEDAAANANTGAATATPQADPVTGEQAPPY